MYFLNWRIDTSATVLKNNFNIDFINYTYIIINELYKNRFIDLMNKTNFYLKQKIKHMFNFQFYFLNFKNFYFDILSENIVLILFLFYIHKKKCMNILYNYNYNYIKHYIYNDFIYRHYTFLFLFSTHYYQNWFDDWNKRILWIFKDFHKHEGPFFYSKKKDVF